MKLEIYNQSYNLSADENEEYLKQIAAYVDRKMHAVSAAAQTADTVKVAVLAAINLADELFQARARQQQLKQPLRERVQKCVTLVENAIQQAG